MDPHGVDAGESLLIRFISWVRLVAVSITWFIYGESWSSRNGSEIRPDWTDH